VAENTRNFRAESGGRGIQMASFTVRSISGRPDSDFFGGGQLPVAVYDKKTGVVYQNLKKEHFQIFEDGVRQEITNFAAPESELSLVLLLENNRRLRDVDRVTIDH
jgi:hypothetical protein